MWLSTSSAAISLRRSAGQIYFGWKGPGLVFVVFPLFRCSVYGVVMFRLKGKANVSIPEDYGYFLSSKYHRHDICGPQRATQNVTMPRGVLLTEIVVQS